jgi:hypothetical protein
MPRGSADFWLASESCCSNPNVTITNKFNANASYTWVNSTTNFQIQYLSGNVSGWIGTCVVAFDNAHSLNQLDHQAPIR